MTISMDGKYQTRDGSKSVRILCVDRPDSLYSVVALLDGSPETFTASGRYTVTSESRLDLLPIPPPPRLVPLEAKDVIAGKTLIRCIKEDAVLVLAATKFGVSYAGVCTNANDDNTEAKTYCAGYQMLFRHGDYSNDHGATWQPCSKPEGAGQ